MSSGHMEMNREKLINMIKLIWNNSIKGKITKIILTLTNTIKINNENHIYFI